MKSLGNVVPTGAERQKIVGILEGLRERLDVRGYKFAAPTYNEKTDTFELRWISGSREWVSVWIDGLFPGRKVCVWRHPSYRYESDEKYLREALTQIA